jgi:hypothetical protein
VITVIVNETGDRAEAEDAESAVVAARTMCDDYTRALHNPRRLTVTFVGPDGAVVAVVPETQLWSVTA